jgi:hypothetical protein
VPQGRGDWIDIFFGEDAPIKKASTKSEKRAEQALQIRDSGKPWMLSTTDVEGKQKDDGGYWPDTHYFDGGEEIGPSGRGFDEPDPLDQPGQFGRRTDPFDAWRMCLNKGGEMALRQLPLLPPDKRSFAHQRQIAWNWACFFFFTPAPSSPPEFPRNGGHPSTPEQQAASGDVYVGAAATGEGYDSPPEYGDSDIPF